MEQLLPQLTQYFSYLMIIMTVIFSLGVVLARSPIFAAMSLIGSLLSTAGIYILLAAPFVAVTQVLVYAGGILVLFIYILMLLGVKQSRWSRPKFIGLVLFFVFSLILSLLPSMQIIHRTGMSESLPQIAENFGSIEEFGRLLIREYAYCFELISVILVVAIAGVVYLTRKES
jgi:NADH-quinone oxidoreductase subunit J